MIKFLNIVFLFLFLGFLSTPTVFAFFEKETPSFAIVEEEEETHKTKVQLGEEDLKALPIIKFSYFLSEKVLFLSHLSDHSIQDDLIIKIVSPPPEFC